MINWQNAGQLLCKIVHILICIVHLWHHASGCKIEFKASILNYTVYTCIYPFAKNLLSKIQRNSAILQEILFANDCAKC